MIQDSKSNLLQSILGDSGGSGVAAKGLLDSISPTQAVVGGSILSSLLGGIMQAKQAKKEREARAAESQASRAAQIAQTGTQLQNAALESLMRKL